MRRWIWRRCAVPGAAGMGSSRHGSAAICCAGTSPTRSKQTRLGGVSPATRRRLRTLAQAGRGASEQGPPVRAGTRLVRAWRGRTYIVTVTDDGVVYDGVTYRSLSAVAHQITGAHWSGPRFFGLRPAARPAAPASAAAHG